MADNTLQEKITGLEENITEIYDYVGKMPADSGSLYEWAQNQITVVNNTIADDKAAQASKNEEFDGRITTNQTNLSSLSGEVERMAGVVDINISNIDMLLEYVGILQQTVVDLEARIAVLEESNNEPTEPDNGDESGEIVDPEGDSSIE